MLTCEAISWSRAKTESACQAPHPLTDHSGTPPSSGRAYDYFAIGFPGCRTRVSRNAFCSPKNSNIIFVVFDRQHREEFGDPRRVRLCGGAK